MLLGVPSRWPPHLVGAQGLEGLVQVVAPTSFFPSMTDTGSMSFNTLDHSTSYLVSPLLPSLGAGGGRRWSKDSTSPHTHGGYRTADVSRTQGRTK